MALIDYVKEKPTLETERLTLRALKPTDVDALSEWMPQPAMYRYWGKRAGKADKDPALLFRSPPKPTKSFHWGVARKSDDRVIGETWVYLVENDRMAKVAFRIGEPYQANGYATEALRAAVAFCFANTELLRLWSDVDVRNVASIRVLENCGFVREGMVRQGKLVSCWCDYYLYGLLKSDPI